MLRRIHMVHFALLLLPVICLVATPCQCSAQDQDQEQRLQLADVFGDHMVLQRQKPIKIWGTAPAGNIVTVSQLSQQTARTTADASGKWMATLPAMDAGGPFELTAKTADQDAAIVLKDILLGEVWLCSGQSNMQWNVRQSANPAKEIAAANYPQIRHLGVPRNQSLRPLDSINAKWQVCSPETAGNFTAVGYYFGRSLHRELNVPIGLINSSWGGTRVEPWTPMVGFEGVPELKSIVEEVNGYTPGTPAYNQKLKTHVQQLEQWLSKAKQGLEDTSKSVPPSPPFPATLSVPKTHQSPTKLYNAMIHPVVGFPMRGAIWYQGESNHVEGMAYFDKKKALIEGWRKLWGQGDFPFYFVQIAPYQYGNEDPTILPKFWEAQTKVTELPNTGMAVISDIGNLKDIHPKNKQDVGARLAAFALKNDYGMDVVAGGPVFDRLEKAAGQLIVQFKNVGQGLRVSNDQPLTDFEIAGAGTGYQPASATIDGNRVILRSDKVEQPLAMRFAWNKLAEPNLVNSAGVPPTAFRAGKLPSPISLVPGLKDYELVYELDFSSLGNGFQYQVDRSEKIGKFNRVAYALEIENGGQPEFVFVAMDAFADSATALGVPRFGTGIQHQRKVNNLEIYSNANGVKTGKGIQGYLEFWPNNYATANGKSVKGASGRVYDHGDQPTAPKNGYGCMQVHNLRDNQTVFAFNHWSEGANADLGIGNSTGESRDWTFKANLNQYPSKRLRVLVRAAE